MRVLLIDIEGTTTPLRFVTDVLFPYARTHVQSFLERHGEDAAVRADLVRLAEEHAADRQRGQAVRPWDGSAEAAVAYVHFLMDQDRKSTGLKALQGRIWEEGYRAGDLRGEVYPDVAPAFERWRRQGRDIAIFSSGSVLAQRLLFGATTAGDLTRQIRAHFDTTTGPKRDPESYRRIAEALATEPKAILFLSDVVEELDAARAAGLRTALCAREKQAAAESHPTMRTFEVVCPT